VATAGGIKSSMVSEESARATGDATADR
jgi:hypothetical protein